MMHSHNVSDVLGLLIEEDNINIRANDLKRLYVGKLWTHGVQDIAKPRIFSETLISSSSRLNGDSNSNIYIPPHSVKSNAHQALKANIPTPPASPPIKAQRLSSFLNLKHFKSLHNDKGPCYTHILNPDGCPYKDDCVYMHVTFDSEGMRQYLAYIRKQPCPEGKACAQRPGNSACPWGHICPEGSACTYTMCRFNVKFGPQAHPTKADAAVDIGWRKPLPPPAPSVVTPPSDVLKPLEDVLRDLKITKDQRPLRSKIGIKLNQEVYNAAGCQSFKEFAERARLDSRFEFGG
jgi:hypothetical protein